MAMQKALQRGGQEPKIAAGNVWFNLAAAQEERGSAGAAIRSYARALRENPGHHFAALNQALLLVKRGGPSAARRAERLLRTAVKVNPRSPGALWNLGLLLAHAGSPEAVATLEQALGAVQRLGWSPRRLAMVLALTGDALREYMSELEEEAEQFEDFCANSEALARHPPLRSALPAALAELRTLPNDPAWLVPWAVETARTFGPDTTAAAYGETLFASWRAVASHPAVASAMGAPEASAVVLGSALGYQCLFFLAAGLPCCGSDLLEESMVGTATDVARRHNLSGAALRFELGDAAKAPLECELSGAGGPSVLWLNDEVWPAGLRRSVMRRAANELVPGSVVVSYGPEHSPPPRGLRLAGSLRARTSWCLAEEIRILERVPV